MAETNGSSCAGSNSNIEKGADKGREKNKEAKKSSDIGLKKENSALEAKNKELVQEIRKLHGQNKELRELAMRIKAEFENYCKRAEKEKEQTIRYAEQQLVKELLPVLDSFENALDSYAGNEDNEYKKGIEMLYSQLRSVFEKRGLREMDALGKELDPSYHEVLMQEDSDEKPGVITKVLQKGYLLNGAVLRHAKVAVSKGKEKKAGKD